MPKKRNEEEFLRVQEALGELGLDGMIEDLPQGRYAVSIFYRFGLDECDDEEELVTFDVMQALSEKLGTTKIWLGIKHSVTDECRYSSHTIDPASSEIAVNLTIEL